MSRLLPMHRILNNFKNDVPVGSSGYVMSQAEAYATLKRISGHDFGDDFAKWRKWVDKYEEQKAPTDEELRETEKRLAKYGVKFPHRDQ